MKKQCGHDAAPVTLSLRGKMFARSREPRATRRAKARGDMLPSLSAPIPQERDFPGRSPQGPDAGRFPLN